MALVALAKAGTFVVLIFDSNWSILFYEACEGKNFQGDNRDEFPPDEEHQVLVTFLDEEAGDVVISENQFLKVKCRAEAISKAIEVGLINYGG